MANNAVTRAQSLTNALTAITYLVSQGIVIEGYEDIDWSGTADTLHKMHQQISKPRAKAVSKARVLNESRAAKVRDAISANGDGVNSKWIADHVDGIDTTQKAVAVCKVAVELGYIHRNVDGKNITYSIV